MVRLEITSEFEFRSGVTFLITKTGAKGLRLFFEVFFSWEKAFQSLEVLFPGKKLPKGLSAVLMLTFIEMPF